MQESRRRRRTTVLILAVGVLVAGGGFNTAAIADPPFVRDHETGSKPIIHAHFTSRSARQPVSAKGVSPKPISVVYEPDVKVTASPAVAQSGARFAITGINATTNINFEPAGKQGVDSWVAISGRMTSPKGAAAVCPWRMEITSALDERERELVRQDADDQSDEPRARRYQMTYAFMQWVTQRDQDRDPDMPMQDVLRGLNGLPARLMKVTGYAEAVVASSMVARPIELKTMEEAVELAPGLTLLITEAQIDERRAVVEFEVRTQRFRDGDAGTPGLEPVFIGIVLRDEAGNVVHVLRDGQEIETRDEFLLVAKHQGLSKDYLKRAKTIEAVAMAGLESMRLNFELSNIDLGRTE